MKHIIFECDPDKAAKVDATPQKLFECTIEYYDKGGNLVRSEEFKGKTLAEAVTHATQNKGDAWSFCGHQKDEQ